MGYLGLLLLAVCVLSVRVHARRISYTFQTNDPALFASLRQLFQNGGQQSFISQLTSGAGTIRRTQRPVRRWRRPATQVSRQVQRYTPRQQPYLRNPQHANSQIGPNSHGLSLHYKQLLLDSHNQYRAELRAADMYALKWNTQLADESLNWAKQCQWGHQMKGRGENLAMISGTGLTLQMLIDYGLKGWYDEKNQWDGKDCMPTGSCHYTQMIWSTTTEVGCAAHVCPDMYYLVCFYSPPGNIRGVSPYRQGRPCSGCNGRCENNLCYW
ncbi:hypothetical protein SNE40_005026 [Patella caerulea]|uniref:SCP domain-containing protein n=1 Tax=Patella caerulea TaxID=87958 RepID=A0AAN8K5X1_PATCE